MAEIEFSQTHFKRISGLMHELVGLSFNDSKKPLIASRLTSRLLRLGLNSFDEYLAILNDNNQAAELQMAIDLLTTNETYFFREPKHYTLIEEELVRRKVRDPIAIWSAASSFGDEAFSTAMLLADMQQAGKIGPDWEILATDISHRVLRSATEAVFPEDRLRDVTPQRLRRYCLKGSGPSEGQVMIQDELRGRVSFGQLNLCKPFEGIGPFDIVFLRNVMIYFDPPTKREVVDRVLSTLKSGGLFFAGTAEGRVQCDTPLEIIQPGAYRKPPRGT
jgi:chemotaxis protein methyltransferase CheR